MNILKSNSDFNPSNSNNFIDVLTDLLDNGKSPKTLLNNMMGKNANVIGAMEYLQNISNSKNPKDIAIQMAKQKGIDPDKLINLANRIGLK